MKFQPSELEILIYWMRERDHVRALKEGGAPKPWTADELLREYRWCNVRRMDDRVSRWLFENWYDDRDDPQDQLLSALYARLINWPDALEEIMEARSPDVARPILQARANRGDKVFTGAYVIPGVPEMNKVDSIMELIEQTNINSSGILSAGSMRGTWDVLIRRRGLGSFLAGQIVADLAHLGLGMDWPDRSTWAPMGPGSARGMNRLLGQPKNQTLRHADFEQLLSELIEVLKPAVPALWRDRQLEAMDIQNCLCEFDKYRRLTLREGKVRARYDGGGVQATLI